MRRDKINHYLDIAQTYAQRGTCLRRNYGAIIVKNDEVIGSGYNGAPRGTENCCDINMCRRSELNVPRGRMFELCRAVHAEQNAIIQARRQDMIDSTLYLTGLDYKTKNLNPNTMPCTLCKRMIINAGIMQVIVRKSKTEYKIVDVNDWVANDDSLATNLDLTTAGY